MTIAAQAPDHRADPRGETPAPSTPSRQPASRLPALDIVRGLVMVLMAIDHVRVYSGVPAGGLPESVFFTRWVTHFCAPVFVFLAGTSAYLHGTRVGDVALRRWLLTRGALLVLLELTVIKWSWTFGADYGFVLAGVIWMLGWCMIPLAPLTRLSMNAMWTFAILIISLQSFVGVIASRYPAQQATWQILYSGGPVEFGGATLFVLYNIIPWIGVMAAGYTIGPIMLREAPARRRWLLRTGTALTLLFLVVSAALAANGSGNPEYPFLLRMLDQNKYRESELFLCMTLGPALLLLALLDGRARGAIPRALAVFGRAPMWYYLLHIPLIHALSLVVWTLRDGTPHAEWFASAPFVDTPDGARWPLWMLYAVFALAVALLYPACAWYARRKAEKPFPWMRYI